MSPKKFTTLTVLGVILISGCTHSPRKMDTAKSADSSQAIHRSSLRVPATSKNQKVVDLASLQTKSPHYQKLEKIFRGEKIRAEAIPEILSQVRTDPKYSDVHLAYVRETYRLLNVEDPFEWMQKNSEHYGSINSYIDPQEDGEPIWATTNRRLRDQEALTPEETTFTENLIRALDALPAIKGIVFRGAPLEAEDLDRYVQKKSVTELPFTSTSIDPQIAQIFASNNQKPNRVSTIFVMRTHSGGPVSAFHPGNNHEVEVLMRPATSFHVDRVLWSKDRKSVFIFMTE